MQNKISAITVYCSSSGAIPKIYLDAGIALGTAIAQNGWQLVYGGNNVGLMGVLADAARAANGKVVGVTPQFFIDKGVDDKRCHEFIVTQCMRTRKAAMEERGDAFIALPGGLGTSEEIYEIIVGKQLGLHKKPIVILNINDYFAPSLAQIELGIEQKFIKPQARQHFFVANTVTAAIDYIKTYTPTAPSDKWFSHNLPPGTE